MHRTIDFVSNEDSGDQVEPRAGRPAVVESQVSASVHATVDVRRSVTGSSTTKVARDGRSRDPERPRSHVAWMCLVLAMPIRRTAMQTDTPKLIEGPDGNSSACLMDPCHAATTPSAPRAGSNSQPSGSFTYRALVLTLERRAAYCGPVPTGRSMHLGPLSTGVVPTC